MHTLALILIASSLVCAQDELPQVVVDRDDFAITKSCRLVVKNDAVIPDSNGDGVIHVKASDVVVEMDRDCALWGARPPFVPDTLAGTGVRVDGQTNVTLRGFRIRAYKVGIHARNADGLKIEGANLSDLWRQHLRSTPAAEDGADWLWPHDNDDQQWRKNYGAAICIERSKVVTIADSKARLGQNGIILDRVEGAKLYDNDFSFLSGWGLAMWRSNQNVISHNAFDFCVRGYSHGVYNRGQDSAGILMFEQCSKNVIAENSITHGGDGIFGFAGKEALGEKPPPFRLFDYTRLGCNDNLFFGNDLSFAPAHGLEMTFSFGNRIRGNKFEGNAICGIWGGYSQDTYVDDNDFVENGGMGYGLERGGVNIEHGYRNNIVRNRFSKNRCGVHLWGGDNEAFRQKPWGAANYRGCRENVIASNRFSEDELGLHLRAAEKTVVWSNEMRGVRKETDADAKSTIEERAPETPFPVGLEVPKTKIELPGSKTPVGARAHLRGREQIIMTEWGPWDHETPFIRPLFTTGSEHVWEIRAFTNPKIAGDPHPPNLDVRIDVDVRPPRLHVKAKEPGVTSYSFGVVNGTDYPVLFPVTGTIISTKWKVRFFRTSAKPHENPEAWKADSAKTALGVDLDSLDLRFGMGGVAEALKGTGAASALERTGAADTRADLGRDHFGLVAECDLPLPKGKWRLTTTSDDGVRVTADGKKVIERWSHHGPEKDTAVLDLPVAKTIPLRVEYFELDGYAVLTLAIEKAE